MLVDSFEQHFESCVLNAQNAKKSARNQISLKTLKNELLKIFRGFRLFEYSLWQKTKTLVAPKINRKLSKQKASSANALPLLENC